MPLRETILSYFEGSPPGSTFTALQIAKAVGLKTAKDVNGTLYGLQREDRLCVSGNPPLWSSLQTSDIALELSEEHGTPTRETSSKDESHLVGALKNGTRMTAKQIARHSKQNKKDVNRTLYSLSRQGKVKKVDGDTWALTDSGNEWSDTGESDTKDATCGDRAESGLSFASFDMVKSLGEGGYGYVYRVQHKIDNKLYALKIVEYDREADREVRALANCEHPNIVRYITAWPERFDWSSLDKDSMSQQSSPPISRTDSDDENLSCLSKHSGPNFRRCLFIQMEFCEGGTLCDWIAERNCGKSKRTKWDALDVFQQVVLGVEYIHSKQFIHRDLKPENILFTAEGKVKIGDFGLVTSATNQNGGILKRTIGAGTKTYMSPEQMDKSDYDNKTDIYPLGLICFELLWELTTGSERAKIWPELRNQIFPAGFCENYSSESQLIYKMLSKAPENRPSAEEIVKYIKTFLLNDSFPSRQRTV
ncbi:protein kinase containing Z-DNA binding domains [Engraulis encrasicolus]|uniref:protein kinase containing Z-DNA binding domains n=1 Tax=Engraulis encrasicolus TaxID=184585 RepID=UPI002FD224CC